MTMIARVSRGQFAIVAMTNLPEGVNRQILRNAIFDLKYLQVTVYVAICCLTKKKIIFGTLLAMYYST